MSSTTAHTFIKEETATLHFHLENTHTITRLSSSDLQIDEYIECLQILSLWHYELLQPQHTYIASNRAASTLIEQRLDKLNIDFRYSSFSHNAIFTLPTLPDSVKLDAAITSREQYLGVLYVLEKSLLNIAFPTSQMANMLGNISTNYFMGYGQYTRQNWNNVVNMLNTQLLTQHKVKAASDMANAYLRFLIKLCRLFESTALHRSTSLEDDINLPQCNGNMRPLNNRYR